MNKATLAGDRIEDGDLLLVRQHGRESGYAEEVFSFCTPEMVIISDESKQYETRETNYAKYAKGIPWNREGVTSIRKVLTTRNDGMIIITAEMEKGCCIQSAK